MFKNINKIISNKNKNEILKSINLYKYRQYLNKKNFNNLDFNQKLLNTINNNNNNNNNKYYSTINNSNNKNNNNNNIITQENNLNEFSFKVEREVKKGDLLLNDIKTINSSIRHYEDALQLTKDRTERALIHYRIALVKYRIGLITESNESLELSIKLLTNGIGDSIREEIESKRDLRNLIPSISVTNELGKMYCLKAMLQEREFDLKNDPESASSQKTLENAIELWKFVTMLNSDLPDGYTGIARCTLKQIEPDLVACINLVNKGLMCSKRHVPTLLLASEMFTIQNKTSMVLVVLNSFFKYYKEFYSLSTPTTLSLLYTLKPKELVDAHFRYGLGLLTNNQYSEALKEFNQSINVAKSNISHPNQMNIIMINSLMEKEKQQFENNYNYNNLNMFSEQEKQHHQNLIEHHGLVTKSSDANEIDNVISNFKEFKFNYNDCSILDIISGNYFSGKCNFLLENYNEAIENFNYVIEKQPNQIKAFKERAECYKSLNDFKNYQKDIKVYNDHRDEIKRRRETHFENYLNGSKKKKEYLQSFGGEEEDDDNEEYDDNDDNEDYEEEEYEEDNEDRNSKYDDYDDFENSRFRKRK